MTGVSTALGIYVVMVFGDILGPIAGGLVLGSIVGAGQWFTLRSRFQWAGRVALASAIAVAVGLLSLGDSMHQTLGGLNPLTDTTLAYSADDVRLNVLVHGLHPLHAWHQLTVACIVLAVSGMMVGALTARSLASLTSRPRPLC